MNYKIIKESSINKLEEEVKRYLKDGYSLVGGVSVTKIDNDYSGIYYCFCQALIKN